MAGSLIDECGKGSFGMYIFLDCVEILGDMIKKCQIKVQRITLQQAKRILLQAKKRIIVGDYLNQTEFGKIKAVSQLMKINFDKQIYYKNVKIKADMQIILVKTSCLPNLYGNVKYYDKRALSLAQLDFTWWKIRTLS